jgi:hypothetical protein
MGRIRRSSIFRETATAVLFSVCNDTIQPGCLSHHLVASSGKNAWVFTFVIAMLAPTQRLAAVAGAG